MTVLMGISDSQCGFKLFSGQAARDIFQRVTLAGWAFDVEALYIARLLGYQIGELPVEWKHDPESRVSPLRDAWIMFWDLRKIKKNVILGKY